MATTEISAVNLADVPNSITWDVVAAASFQNLPTLTDDQANALISACQIRLLSELCLTAIPTDNLAAWQMLLANYVAAVVAANKSGIVPVQSKSVRNFSITIGNNGQINLKAFYDNFSDLLGMFSQCHNGVMFQSPNIQNEDFPDGLRPGDILPDLPAGRW